MKNQRTTTGDVGVNYRLRHRLLTDCYSHCILFSPHAQVTNLHLIESPVDPVTLELIPAFHFFHGTAEICTVQFLFIETAKRRRLCDGEEGSLSF